MYRATLVCVQDVLERDSKGLAETRADSREMLGLSLGGEDLSVHGQKVKGTGF